MPKRCPSAGSNQGLDRSEAGHSEPSRLEFKARGVSLTPSREASVDCAKTASEGGTQDSRHFDSPQAQVEEVVRSSLQDHDRMSSGRRYCLQVTVYEVTKRGCRALPTVVMNSAGIVNLMEDDLDVAEAVILDHITAILYVGQCSAGKGLTEEEPQACIEHFTLMSNGGARQSNMSSKP